MTKLTRLACLNPECTNTFIPHPKAKRAFYCSDKCSQKCYRERKKQDRLAKSKTVTIEQSIGYQWLEEIIPEMTAKVEELGVIFSHEVCISAYRVIGEIGLMLKEKTEQCAGATT